MDATAYFENIHDRDWRGPEDDVCRLAVLGLGNFARTTVLPSLADSESVDVTALVSGDAEKAHNVAADHGVETTLDYEDFQEGRGTDAYDAVYVGGPNATHHDNGRVAADHGKHVIVEKPVAATRAQAAELVQACEDAGVTLMVAYRPQIEPVLRRLRSLIRDGGIGDVVQVHAGFSGELLAMNPDHEQWRLDPAMAGGGALLDVGVYPLNTTRFLLDADPVAVQATTHSSHEAFDAVDEHVAFQLTFPDGATASCTASYNAYPDNRIQIIGTEGVVTVDPAYDAQVRPTVEIAHDDHRETVTPPFVDEVREEFEYFAACTEHGRTPEPDGQDSCLDMAAVEAIYASAERGERVDVEQP